LKYKSDIKRPCPYPPTNGPPFTPLFTVLIPPAPSFVYHGLTADNVPPGE